ncbi:MAG: UDP-N-acetylglucosamine 4,6-dehydratase family protein, partial [Beijerinckiaceae bacterium]
EAIPPKDELFSCVRDRNVMITGAGGSIGSELCRQILSRSPKSIVLYEMSEFALYSIDQELQTFPESRNTQIIPVLGSVCNGERLREKLKKHKIQTLFHAAAYKHVPLVEGNPLEGVRNNTIGTLEVADAALEAGVERAILISTDKAVRPTNVMGATKRMAELAFQLRQKNSNGTVLSMVRFGNVIGSSGSVIPLFKKQIEAGGPVTVTHRDIVRYFMTIPEAAQLVVQAGSMGAGADVFLLDMGQPVSIYDLARRMIHLAGHDVKDEANPDGDIEIRFSGLRPGEKLYEELLVDGNSSGTAHPKIMREAAGDFDAAELERDFARLRQAVDSADEATARDILARHVEGFAQIATPGRKSA